MTTTEGKRATYKQRYEEGDDGLRFQELTYTGNFVGMEPVTDGIKGDKMMKSRAKSGVLEKVSKSDVLRDEFTIDELNDLNNYLAWNIWDVLVMRATEGVSGMIPRQEYEVAADVDTTTCKDLATGLTTTIRQEQPELRLTWGVSRAHEDAVELASAANEARTALSAAHRLGGENVFLYEELGIVRLLLGSGDDPDLQTFIDDVTGPLIAYDRENDGSLIRTLRGFFDADCSQRVGAERLFIHHKTLRYRLERIRQLTGLNLSRHEDRMRADFAMRLLQINGTRKPDAAEPETL